jgi:hypothetical protein
MGLDPAALDRYITGNYGEDFFRDDVEEIEPDEEEPTNPFYREPDLVPDAGGYDVFAVMDDGDVLCRKCVLDPTNPVHDERSVQGLTTINSDGWGVVAFEHTGNLEEPECCSHCNKEIA